MGRARTPWLAAMGALLVGLGAFVPGARADEPDRSAWLVGREYVKAAVVPLGEAGLEIYSATDLDPTKELDEAAVRVLVVRGEDVVETYHGNLAALPDGARRLDLRWEDQGVEDAGVLVSIALLTPQHTLAAAAQQAAVVALKAAGPWRDAAALLATALGEAEPARRRPLALAAYRALEGAYDANRGHLGIYHDLLVADQVLAPLEASSDRGANLAFLWREHVAAAQRSGDPGLISEARRTLAVAALAESCYALAAGALAAAPEGEDPELEALRSALARLNQGVQEEAGGADTVGRTGSVRLTLRRCTAEPPSDGTLFHRLTFLCFTPAVPEVPGPVWYSLTCEKNGERARWSLYGWVGGSRRLLHLYGTAEPDAGAVADEVLGLVRSAVQAEEGK